MLPRKGHGPEAERRGLRVQQSKIDASAATASDLSLQFSRSGRIISFSSAAADKRNKLLVGPAALAG